MNKAETSMKELEAILKELRKQFKDEPTLQRTEITLDDGDILIVKRLVITTGGIV